MRPAPDFLPGAHSKKWHRRRWWDWLGYLRVRTLANPSWHRDVGWLTGVIRSSRPVTPGPERDQLDRALARLRVYGAARLKGTESLAAYDSRLAELWDDFLEAIDVYLEMTDEGDRR